MAIVKGAFKTIYDAAAGPASFNAKGTYDSELKCMVDSYEASALANGSIIEMGTLLPAGARIQGVTMAFDALFGAGTIACGDSASTARYIAATSAASASRTQAIDIDGLDYVIGTAAGDNRIFLTITGGSTATGTIKVSVWYTNA